MLYIKIILALLLVLSVFELAKLKGFFKPLLIVYMLISSIVFYLIVKEAFIIDYSGTDLLMSEDGVQVSVILARNWVSLLVVLGFIYSLPGMFFIPRLRAMPYLVLILLVISILPDVCSDYVWGQLLMKVSSKG